MITYRHTVHMYFMDTVHVLYARLCQGGLLMYMYFMLGWFANSLKG